MSELQSKQLQSKLRQAQALKEGSYDKRTEHLDPQGNAIFINRLILEDSPYLLQHAHNPVNWYPWSEEAFADAEQQGKPLFLSIGYSTCHWCHVMEVESFDNEQVADVLNSHFISVKIDREQYPDIDEIYMTGVQLMSGQGGWPMSNFLLADGKPFYAATYFPAAQFINVLQQISGAWDQRRDELEASAIKISEAIDKILSDNKAAASLSPQIIEDTLQALYQREDRAQGGLVGSPKFPQEPLLLLMLDRARRDRDLEAMGFVSRALEAMARGGIFDQLGGGFHRYSVDAQWLVPHFEKMLYNQSQLGLAYLQAYQLTGNSFFKRVCEQTLDYVLRDMQLPDGGFYSATDADSEGQEGTFFVWTVAELEAALDSAEQKFVTKLFGVSEFGNFEGSNILHLSKPLSMSAEEAQRDDFYPYLDGILSKLYKLREQRIHPLRDDKLIVAWSAAMITTLAKAAYSTGKKDYLIAAEKAAQFIWLKNVTDSGQLKRIFLNDTVSILGQLEDYAAFIEALIALFDVTNKSSYLKQAAQLMEAALAEFWDEEGGGFFLSPAQQTGPQLTRSRNASDGAILSAVASALQCLLSLARRSELMDASYRRTELSFNVLIDSAVASISPHINEQAMSHASCLRAITEQQQGALDVIQYANGGRAKVTLRKTAADSEFKLLLECSVSVQPEWHVTANQQSEGEFFPIQLSTAEQEDHWSILRCSYPEPVRKLKSGDKNLISIYEGSFTIRLELERAPDQADLLCASAGLSLRLQLCGENSCLLPQTLYFRI